MIDPVVVQLEIVRDILASRTLDIDRIVNIVRALRKASAWHALVEFGSYRGLTSALISSIAWNGSGKVHIYDSFEGLPEPDKDAAHYFVKGLFAAKPKDVHDTFEKYGLRTPKIVKGWFEQLKPEQLPERISFAHIDADFYSGTRAVLNLVYPKLVPGGVMVIDDYGWNQLPGVKRAVDEFMSDKPEKVTLLIVGSASGQASVVKL